MPKMKGHLEFHDVVTCLEILQYKVGLTYTERLNQLYKRQAEVLDSSPFLIFIRTRWFTVETWHISGLILAAREALILGALVSINSSDLRVYSWMKPFSIPTAKSPCFCFTVKANPRKCSHMANRLWKSRDLLNWRFPFQSPTFYGLFSWAIRSIVTKWVQLTVSNCSLVWFLDC